jgi:hypothetical protein
MDEATLARSETARKPRGIETCCVCIGGCTAEQPSIKRQRYTAQPQGSLAIHSPTRILLSR